MRLTSKLVLVGLILLLTLNLACKRQPKSTADLPPVLSHAYNVSVAPFTQPHTPTELILGRIPENQGLITPEELAILDGELQQILHQNSSRHFTFLKLAPQKPNIDYHTSAQPEGLQHWLAYGKSQNADILLVPQVLNWHEREGSAAGVTTPAWVRVEFFLLKVSSGRLMHRSIYEEHQQALADNFLKIGEFLNRKGSWVSATDLAKEGMFKARKEFGL